MERFSMRGNPLVHSLRRLSLSSNHSHSSHSSSEGDFSSEDDFSSEELLLELNDASSAGEDTITRTTRPTVALYGRTKEKACILDHIDYIMKGDHMESQLVLLTGPFGTGKTALGLSLRPFLRERKGSFVQGQFNPPRSTENSPPTLVQSPLLAAMADFCDSVLLSKSYEEESKLRRKMVKAVGNDMALLTNLIPALVDFVGNMELQDNADADGMSTVSSSTLEARARRSVCRFVSSICSLEQPLLMFLDNLQWADKESLQLLRALLTDADTEGLVMVCACRSDEISVHDNLSVLLRSMEDHDGLKIMEVRLDNLKPDDVLDLTLDTLSTTRTLCTSIAEFVYEQTKGNCYYTVQLLRTMRQSGLAAPSPSRLDGSWTQGQTIISKATYSCTATLAFWSGNFQESVALFEKAKKHEFSQMSLTSRCKLFFLDGISNVLVAMNTSKKQRRWLSRARHRLQLLRICLQKTSTREMLEIQLSLLEAGLASAEGDVSSSIPKYEKVVMQASMLGMIHTAALAAEMLGLSYYRAGIDQLKESIIWLGRALTIYSEFGAHGKARELAFAIQKLESVHNNTASCSF